MNILITGRPGAGKTTLIKEISKKLGAKVGGFYTEEMRKSGRRTGFRVETFDGKRGVLSSVGIDSLYRVGKYKVDLDGFEDVALPAIEDALDNSKIIVIDEIGPMELFSKRFKEAVLKAFDSSSLVVATIKLKGSRFVEKIKIRDDVILFDLDNMGKEEVLKKVLENVNKCETAQ